MLKIFKPWAWRSAVGGIIKYIYRRDSLIAVSISNEHNVLLMIDTLQATRLHTIGWQVSSSNILEFGELGFYFGVFGQEAREEFSSSFLGICHIRGPCFSDDLALSGSDFAGSGCKEITN
jgi:hypothetical protein